MERDCFEGFARYTLDPASVRAALALKVQAYDRVLDLCAAPGGKTLVLLEGLQGCGSLVANELSSDRRRRLKEVIASHVPENLQSLVTVTGFDGNQFGLKKKASFDRVLLDAPCSSERHLMEEDETVPEWKESRTRQLAMRQYSLLCSAALSLKKGGTLVYSTCSISPLENDGVIERLLKKKGDQVELDPDTSDLSDLEATRYGFQIFPDRAKGSGPIYIARLRVKD
ncbi:MAG: RsmB/NOP family class I SAM-dependent RNA methyltransferase [Bdellovibrionales bacterium]|nr:RsmB/NOP family class I SAM-dependent RNA methyltransferase [Bdellovibrionales bacterium]